MLKLRLTEGITFDEAARFGMADELRKNALPTTERVRQLDEIFIRRNLSPGGCADLLAVSYFLYDWKQRFGTE